MDREGIKSIATMRQGKGVMLKPPPAAGALPGGPVPQASGAQLRDRARAKQAYQSERPASSSLPTGPAMADIVAERRGPLLARQDARQIDFDQAAAQRKQVENLMQQNNKYVAQKSVRAAHQELDQLGNTLGSAYKELHPLQREAIEGRAEQLRSLVRSQDPDQVLEAGRRRQAAYRKVNALRASRAREREYHREQLGPHVRTESAMGGADASYVPAHIRTGRPAASDPGVMRRHGAGFLEPVS